MCVLEVTAEVHEQRSAQPLPDCIIVDKDLRSLCPTASSWTKICAASARLHHRGQRSAQPLPDCIIVDKDLRSLGLTASSWTKICAASARLHHRGQRSAQPLPDCCCSRTEGQLAANTLQRQWQQGTAINHCLSPSDTQTHTHTHAHQQTLPEAYFLFVLCF